eukprot:s1301_g11.t1
MVLFSEVMVQGTCVSVRASWQGSSEWVADHGVLCSSKGWLLHLPMADLTVQGDGIHFSLFGYEVKFMDGQHVLLCKSQGSFVLGHHGDPQFNQLVELCCGLGGISSGAYYAGMQILGGIDISPWAVQVFNDNHPCSAIQGDIKDHAKLGELAANIGHKSVGFAMGFPCPPFSTRGDQLGFSDQRAWTFVHGLEAAYMLRASFVLLECTPKVESFAPIVQYLDMFCETMGFRWTSQILHLDEAWPVRRTRWWCLLVPAELFPFVCLSDLPRAPQLQTLSSLLPVWPQWPSADLEELIWTQQEVDFHEQYAILGDLCLDLSGKCPTLLHSLGHLDRACPCGCRSSGLSHLRLSRDGISTAVLQMPEWDGFRHLHPLEAAFMCTLPPNFCFRQLRAALPLIEQTAAPMQAHWMLSSLLAAIQKWSGSQKPLDLTACHMRFQQHLRQMAFHLWPSASNMVPRSVTLRFPQDCCIMFEIHAGLRLEHLIMAQKSIGGWLNDHEVTYQGTVVPPDAILHAGVYDITTPSLSVDSAGLRFVIRMEGRAWSGPFGAGITVSALLATLGFVPSQKVCLQINGVDLPANFQLTCSFNGLLHRPVFHGAGPSCSVGLTNFHLDAEAARLVRLCPYDPGFLYLSALDLTRILLLPMSAVQDALWSLLDSNAVRVFGFFCLSGHWRALSLDRSKLVVTYYDGLLDASASSVDFPLEVHALIHLLLGFFELDTCEVRHSSLVIQTSGQHCGAIALANLGGFLGLWTSFSEAAALQWFDQLHAAAIVGAGAVEYTKAHGLLVQELPKHGVPMADAPARATMALKKLGVPPILKAFDAKHPWQALKALGNNTDRPFQWVTHAELEQHID